MENKEQINYDAFTLDPTKNVEVPVQTYVALTNLVQAVEEQHSKRIRTDVYAYFHKKTHAKLSAKGKAKIKQEDLDKNYYENIDLEASSKKVRIDRDELGSAAIRLLAEFRGIFKLNVDNGNRIARELGPKSPKEATLTVTGDES